MTEEEKASFLALLRAGNEPPKAAEMVQSGYTASMFRRLTNEKSRDYDPFFAAEYLRARAEGRQRYDPVRAESNQPRTTTLSGHVKANYLTDEMLQQFLEFVADGVHITKAAEELEPKTSLTQINRRAAKDPLFAEAYAVAKEQGYPAFKERLRAEAIRQAFAGDYKALRDQLLVHDEDFRKVLLAQKHEISGGDAAIRLIAEKALPELPKEMLEQLISGLEQRQIGTGEDIAA